MELGFSILKTLYTDIYNKETATIAALIHGSGPQATDPAKLAGQAGAMQWLRVILGAIDTWVSQNPSATEAPASFLPENNEQIRDIINPPAPEQEVSASENSNVEG